LCQLRRSAYRGAPVERRNPKQRWSKMVGDEIDVAVIEVDRDAAA
jgi:hypothetical protein